MAALARWHVEYASSLLAGRDDEPFRRSKARRRHPRLVDVARLRLVWRVEGHEPE
jgi:hypothetical protein